MRHFTLFTRFFRNSLLTLTSALLLAAPGASQASDSFTRSDHELINALARGNLAEIQLGNLAKEKGSSRAVKDFGGHMATDHAKLEQQLKKWAATNDVTLPDQVSTEETSLYNKLSKLSGSEFDKEYISSMLKDHKKDVSELQTTAINTKNTAIKGLAVKTLPVLQGHLLMAENVAGSIGIKDKGTS